MGVGIDAQRQSADDDKSSLRQIMGHILRHPAPIFGGVAGSHHRQHRQIVHLSQQGDIPLCIHHQRRVLQGVKLPRIVVVLRRNDAVALLRAVLQDIVSRRQRQSLELFAQARRKQFELNQGGQIHLIECLCVQSLFQHNSRRRGGDAQSPAQPNQYTASFFTLPPPLLSITVLYTSPKSPPSPQPPR